MLLMSKGSKEALTVLIVTHVTHVKGSKDYNLDTFNAMSKGSKRLCYVETRDIHIFAHNFLNI